MKNSRRLIWGMGLGLLVLAACDGGGGGGSAAVQSQFGDVFARSFAQTATDTPISPIGQNAIVYKGVTGSDPAAFPLAL